MSSASGRVSADPTAEVEETTDFDRLGKRADRGGASSGEVTAVLLMLQGLPAGELDVAAVLSSEGKAAPPPLGSDRRLRICLTA